MLATQAHASKAYHLGFGKYAAKSTLGDVIPYEENSFYIFDRGYNDFKRLHKIESIGAYFIVRGKKNNDFKTMRWKIELFFKWIKQHLKIKKFWGTSENAVRIQIYSAITAYCMMAIIQKKMNIDRTIYEMLQIVSVSLTDTTNLKDLFEKPNYNIVNELDGSTEPTLF